MNEIELAIKELERASSLIRELFNIEAAEVGLCAQCNAWDDTLEKGICQTCIREGESENICTFCNDNAKSCSACDDGYEGE